MAVNENAIRTWVNSLIKRAVCSRNSGVLATVSLRPQYGGVRILEASGILGLVLLSAVKSHSRASCCTLARKANQRLVLCVLVPMCIMFSCWIEQWWWIILHERQVSVCINEWILYGLGTRGLKTCPFYKIAESPHFMSYNAWLFIGMHSIHEQSVR